MSLKIGVISQKGGVGKSTIARLIACEYARNGWEVKLADMDTGQGTSASWQNRRLITGIEPEISVEQFASVARALRVEAQFDLLVFDGSPRSTAVTLDIAKVADLVVLPTGLSIDDLEPTILLGHDLKKKGIARERMALALCKVGDSSAEIEEAKEYIDKSGYYLLNASIPNRTAYRRASDTGHTLNETAYRSLNEKADALVQDIIDRIDTLAR